MGKRAGRFRQRVKHVRRDGALGSSLTGGQQSSWLDSESTGQQLRSEGCEGT